MSFAKSALVSMFLESVFWGILTLTYLITLFLLCRKPSEVISHVPHLAITSIVFILCTVHVVMGFTRTSHGFVGNPEHPEVLLSNISDFLYRAKYGVLFITVFIGDLVIISRCFFIWNKKFFIVVIPTLTAIGTLVSASGALHAMKSIAGSGDFASSTLQRWMVATYSAAVVTKVICVALVMFRVRQIHTQLTKNINRHVHIYTTLLVLIESGFLALLMAIILLPTAIVNIDEHYIFCDVLSPVTGLAIMLILSGMSIELADTPVSPVSPTAWRQSIIPANRSNGNLTRRPTGTATRRWDDFDDMKGSPAIGAEHFEDANKSTGTLNLGIVI